MQRRGSFKGQEGETFYSPGSKSLERSKSSSKGLERERSVHEWVRENSLRNLERQKSSNGLEHKYTEIQRGRSVKDLARALESANSAESTVSGAVAGRSNISSPPVHPMPSPLTQKHSNVPVSVTDALVQTFQEKQRAEGTQGAMLSRSEKTLVVPYEILGMDGNLFIQFSLLCVALILLFILAFSISVTNSLEAKLIALQRVSKTRG